MRLLGIILIASLSIGLMPRKDMNRANSELRASAYQIQEETDSERLLEYLESMLRITDRKIDIYKDNFDQLQLIYETLDDLHATIKRIEPNTLNLTQIARLMRIEKEYHRQWVSVEGLIRSHFSHVRIAGSA